MLHLSNLRKISFFFFLVLTSYDFLLSVYCINPTFTFTENPLLDIIIFEHHHLSCSYLNIGSLEFTSYIKVFISIIYWRVCVKIKICITKWALDNKRNVIIVLALNLHNGLMIVFPLKREIHLYKIVSE